MSGRSQEHTCARRYRHIRLRSTGCGSPRRAFVRSTDSTPPAGTSRCQRLAGQTFPPVSPPERHHSGSRPAPRHPGAPSTSGLGSSRHTRDYQRVAGGSAPGNPVGAARFAAEHVGFGQGRRQPADTHLHVERQDRFTRHHLVEPHLHAATSRHLNPSSAWRIERPASAEEIDVDRC